MKEELQKAIEAHGYWKYLLQETVRTSDGTGDSSLIIKDVKDSRLCRLGKWLDSPQGRTLYNYAEIVQVHQAFHEEAAHILTLAFYGKKVEAEAKMQPGSRYNQLTVELINRLTESEEYLDGESLRLLRLCG